MDESMAHAPHAKASWTLADSREFYRFIRIISLGPYANWFQTWSVHTGGMELSGRLRHGLVEDAAAQVTATIAEMDISDAPPPPLPVMTAKKIAEEQAERARNVLDLLHPSTSAAGPSALDAATTETVKTIAEHSGLGAEAIAAMLKLDVAAVRAALES